MDDQRIRFCELTPRGRGAVAVVGLAGSKSLSVLQQCFTSIGGKPFAKIKRPVLYGHWNSTGEDLIIVRLAADNFEIHCHGGSAAVDSIKTSLLQHDAEEFDHSSNWDRQQSEWNRDTLEKLSRCQTERCAKILLNQLEIANSFFEDIASQCSLFLKSTDANNREDILSRVSDQIDQSMSWATFGRHLVEDWSVVFCGHPNAGKSSLINGLVGFERAIVHSTAGTTRDVLVQQTALDGWPIILKDTAGLREIVSAKCEDRVSETVGEVEKIGIEKARTEIESADLVILVIDLEDNKNGTMLPDVKPAIVVANKIDLVELASSPEVLTPPGATQLDAKLSSIRSSFSVPIVPTSAKTKAGLQELEDAISSALISQLPSKTQLVPVSHAQQILLQQMKSHADASKAEELFAMVNRQRQLKSV